jgi:hypothetical protein
MPVGIPALPIGGSDELGRWVDHEIRGFPFRALRRQKGDGEGGIPELLKRLAPLGLVARARRVWHGPSHRARLLCAALLMTASSFGLSMAVASLGAL